MLGGTGSNRSRAAETRCWRAGTGSRRTHDHEIEERRDRVVGRGAGVVGKGIRDAIENRLQVRGLVAACDDTEALTARHRIRINAARVRAAWLHLRARDLVRVLACWTTWPYASPSGLLASGASEDDHEIAWFAAHDAPLMDATIAAIASWYWATALAWRALTRSRSMAIRSTVARS